MKQVGGYIKCFVHYVLVYRHCILRAVHKIILPYMPGGAERVEIGGKGERGMVRVHLWSWNVNERGEEGYYNEPRFI